jgi:Cys-tRNA synthase (O-phospho-L-seryl-tRNA:Cys-tRNA synthase)
VAGFVHNAPDALAKNSRHVVVDALAKNSRHVVVDALAKNSRHVVVDALAKNSRHVVVDAACFRVHPVVRGRLLNILSTCHRQPSTKFHPNFTRILHPLF